MDLEMRCWQKWRVSVVLGLCYLKLGAGWPTSMMTESLRTDACAEFPEDVEQTEGDDDDEDVNDDDESCSAWSENVRCKANGRTGWTGRHGGRVKAITMWIR